MALGNSAATHNDIKQAPHISPPPPTPAPTITPFVCTCTATDGAHNDMSLSPQGPREPGSASAEEGGDCHPVAQNHTPVLG